MLSETAGSPSTTAEVLFKVIHAQYDALYQPPGGTRIWPNEQTLRPDGKASTHAVRTIDAPYWNGIALDVTKDSLIKYIPTRSEVRGKIVFMGPDSVPADAVAIFLTFFEFWNLISRIFIFQGPENRFWGLGTFLGCPKIIDLFTILRIFYEFELIRGIS